MLFEFTSLCLFASSDSVLTMKLLAFLLLLICVAFAYARKLDEMPAVPSCRLTLHLRSQKSAEPTQQERAEQARYYRKALGFDERD